MWQGSESLPYPNLNIARVGVGLAPAAGGKCGIVHRHKEETGGDKLLP